MTSRQTKLLIYCPKCREKTLTNNVDQDITKNNRNRLVGNCKKCGTQKSLFTDNEWNVSEKSQKKKSPEEKAIDKAKRHTATTNRKAKEIGLRIYNINKNARKNIKTYLNEAEIGDQKKEAKRQN